MTNAEYLEATLPNWVGKPTLDAVVGPDLVPLAWPYWSEDERWKYANQFAMSTGPGWTPPHPVCDGCHWDRPDWRWMVKPHPAGGWWHAATCTPPTDWTPTTDWRSVNG